jgi:Ca-activated chloride channel family protein
MNRSLIQVAVKTGVADSLSKKLNVSLCFVLDVSGSMGFDNKLEDAKKALLSAVSVMKNGDEFALVVFSNDAQTIIEPQILNQENRIQIMEIIRGLKEQGGTNIQAGLLQGYFELTKFKNREYSRLLLLTDGNSNIDIVTPEQLAKKLNVEYVEGLRISTIGLGYDVNQELLRKIAKNGSGHYYFVDKSETLTSIIKNDLSSLVVPAVKNVKVSINTKAMFKILNIYGFEGSAPFSPTNALIEFQELNMNDWRILIVEIERKNIVSGITIPVEVSMECETVKESQKINLKDNAKITWFEGKPQQQIKPNLAVAKNSLIFGNAVSLIQVGKLTEHGGYKEALDVLNLQINNNLVYYEVSGSNELKPEIERLLNIRKILLKKVKDKSTELEDNIIALQNEVYTNQNTAASNQSVKKSNSNLKKIVNLGLDIAETVTPGICTTIARLISNAIFK